MNTHPTNMPFHGNAAAVVEFLMHKKSRIEQARARMQKEIERERLFRHLLNQYSDASLAGVCHALEKGSRAIDEGCGYLAALKAAKRVLGAPAYQRGKLA